MKKSLRIICLFPPVFSISHTINISPPLQRIVVEVLVSST